MSTALSQSVASIAVTASRAFPYLVGFFATSLVALPVARLRSVRARTRASENAITISSDWYAALAGAVASILGVALAASAILRLDVGTLVQAVGRVADAVLWAMLYVVALPLGFIAAGIIWVVQHLLHLGADQPPRSFTGPQWTSGLPNQGAAGLPPAAATTRRWGIGVVIAILAVVWLARAVFRYERLGMAQAAEEVHESVWSWADLGAA